YRLRLCIFCYFNDTPSTAFYTLSYTTLFRSWGKYLGDEAIEKGVDVCVSSWNRLTPNSLPAMAKSGANYMNSQLIKMEALLNGRSEEHTSELQSLAYLVCRLLLEKKKQPHKT